MMPQLYETASTAFLFVYSSDRASQVRARLEDLDPLPHLIIRRAAADGCSHYLVEWRRYLAPLAAAAAADTLDSVLRLDREKPVPAFGAHLDAKQSPERCVVLEDGWVTGFIDKVHPPLPQRGSRPKDHGVEALLDTVFPDSMAVSETASLLVALSSGEERFGATPVPYGETLDIVAVASDHFEAAGSLEGCIELSDPPSLPLQFKLRAIQPGCGRIRILVFHRGAGIAQTVLITTIAEKPEVQRPFRHYRQSRVTLLERQPDLSLWIFESPGSGNETFVDFRVSAANPALSLNMKSFGCVSLGYEPQKFAHELFESIEDLFGDDNAQRVLERQGARLFEIALPKTLRDELWSLRDRIRYVQIQSDEPWIPWEICRLWGRGPSGRFEEENFFCESFAVTRWRPGIGQKLTLSLRRLALVVADSDLPAAPEEREVLCSLIGEDRDVQEVPPTLKSVEKAFMSGRFDGIHFACHGSLNELDLQVLHLGHQEKLTPGHITGLVANLGDARPLVFLNACSSGRTFRRLNTIDGWAQRFLSAGCSAFLGAYWETEDKACLAFTRAFYDGLISGKPISEAARGARAASKRKGGTSWLAYTVYAHPLATIESVSIPDPP